MVGEGEEMGQDASEEAAGLTPGEGRGQWGPREQAGAVLGCNWVGGSEAIPDGDAWGEAGRGGDCGFGFVHMELEARREAPGVLPIGGCPHALK